MKSRQYVFLRWALGVVLCLIGAFLMLDGSILGDKTVGIATVIEIIGICSTFTPGSPLASRKSNKRREA